jgi:hypothetical protein
MRRLALLGFSRLAYSGLLSVLLSAACGGESETFSDDPKGGKGGSAGSSAGKGGASAGTSGGSKASTGGAASGSGGKGAGGSAAGSGGNGASGGTEGGAGGEDSSGGTAGTGGTGGTGATSGSGGSGGSGGEPPEIPIDQSCDTFDPCGGEPEGSWTIVDTCIETEGDVEFLDAPGCEDALQGVGALVVGSRTYEDGVVTFEQTVTARAAFIVNDACAQGLLMNEDVDAEALCPLLPSLAQASMEADFESIECELVDGLCNCDVIFDGGTTMTTTDYVVNGTQITESGGSTYEFCQQGDSLILNGFNDTDTGVMQELTVEFERD